MIVCGAVDSLGIVVGEGEDVMGYRLRSGEAVEEGVRRICREQLDKAARELTGSEDDLHEGVHQARKRFKKIRAVLRLVRPALGEAYAVENAWFRDAAGELSRARDAAALVETVDRLGDTFADQVDESFLDRVRVALGERRARLTRGEVDLQGRVDDLAEAVGGARDRVAGWTLDAEGFDAIGPGFAKTYARGRSALAAAYSARTAESFHEFRKRAKYHRYHLRVLVPVWPAVLKPFRTAAHDLTDLLGENQDLHVLRETLRTETELLGNDRDAQALLGLLEQRQAELRSRAQPLGRRVFAEQPKAATARLGAYWQAWAESAEGHA